MVQAAVASAGALVLRGEVTRGILIDNGVAPEGLPSCGCPAVLLARYSPLERLSLSAPPRVALCLPIDYKDLTVQMPALAEALRAFSVSPGVRVLCQDAEDVSDAKAFGAPGLIWSSIPTWLRWLQDEVEVVISFRIHGALAGLAGGVRTVIVPRGSRINELTKRLALPSLNVQDARLVSALMAGPSETALLVDAIYSEAFPQAVATWEKILAEYTSVVKNLVSHAYERPDPALVPSNFRAERSRNPYFDDLSAFRIALCSC